MKKLLIAVCGWVLNTGFAADFQYYVTPLQGITGISQSALKSAANTPAMPKYSAMINEKYADIFYDSAAQKALIAQFTRAVENAFPKSVIGPNQIVTAGRHGKYAYQPYEKVQCSPTFKVGYRDVFAMSMGISRLSVYLNDYSDFTQVLVPVTYTVRFTKLNGASVVFSKSQTIYTQYESLSRDFYSNQETQEIAPEVLTKLRQAILADGSSLVGGLVEQAVKNFKPQQSTVTIVGKDGPYFIFDRGSEIGFNTDEEFYPQDEAGKEYGFVIKYATNRLAVGVPSSFTETIRRETASLNVGKKLEFSFDQPGKDDAKLSVMAVHYTPLGQEPLPNHYLVGNALQSIIADDLGFTAPFNLIKQDPDFARLKTQIRSEASCESSMYSNMPGFSDASTNKRSDPDYFLKVDTFSSPVFTAAGVGGTTLNHIFSNAVSLSLIDRSTVVRQVFTGSHQYELKRTDNKGLSVGEAREINLKNASLSALKSLVSNFNPKVKTIKVTNVSGKVATLEAPISPIAFNQIRLVRPIKVAALNKTIMLPISKSGDDGVLFEAPAETSNTLQFKGQNIKASDVLVLTDSGESSNLLRACGEKRKGRFLLHPSLKHGSNADHLLLSAVGSELKSYDLLESSSLFIHGAEYALRDGFFQTDKIANQVATPFCMVPVELQNLKNLQCVSGKCSGKAEIASAVRIFNDANKVADSALPASFDFSEIEESELPHFVAVKTFEHQLKSVPLHVGKIQ